MSVLSERGGLGGEDGKEGKVKVEEKLKALVFNSEVRKDPLSSPGRPSAPAVS